MLNVAILGYGRQGKKHEKACKLYGLATTIFTKTGSDGSKKIIEFQPNDYGIIICAISPILEQTKILELILSRRYQNYLIIEKPITYSQSLLEKLVIRKRTIFFLDEIFLPLIPNIEQPKGIHTISSDSFSDFALIEHAIANFLREPVGSIDFSKITFTHSVGQELGYRVTFRKEKTTNFQNMKNLNFSSVYEGVFLQLKNEVFHENIRNNYFLFRKVPSFSKYLLE